MIEFKNFSFKYEKSDELNVDNLNLKIEKGQLVLFTGPSGSGKTSILKLLNGLAPEFFEGGFKGELKVAHLSIGNSLSEFSDVVGSVFQNPKNQFFHLDSTSELAFSMENKGYKPELIKQRIVEVAEEFSAKHLIDREILGLSGGEKQKLAFMSNMMLDADIYILDEVTSNLDLKSIDLITDVIKKLKDKGKTIVIAEHRIYYLKDLIDRMFIVVNGKLIHEFSQEDIKDFDGTKCRTRQLDMSKVNILKKKKIINKNGFLKLVDFSYKIIDKNITINKSFSTGRVYSIIGENGCGKTTFANALSGFIKSNGNIILDEKKLRKKDLIKNSFMVMQDVNYQLFTNSVEGEIKLGATNLEEFDSIVEKLNLKHLLKKHPNMLSGGEKQRVVIASALISNKKILILDEPTSGLDFKNMYELANLLKEVAKKDIIIIIITHDYEFLCTVADEVLYFDSNGINEKIEASDENKNKILDLMMK
ncbi:MULTISPECIES: ATP-binding cassette domain-containing protein [unclassified Gemella]|uniref:ATP-binding cassette domain-containing protein n=1 Tax=unclassified Gemella TaxID=2624949 RepID=UPI0010745ACB|nr:MULTISPECIES: ABC transporter ATP-binding protein [unclassified Gemella]MBF0709643.1 ABC transporter ATP-binding protein [Gemella sp. GL1.1]MBF0746938.1 ABC transporter ATP-binding protein [Gemella sp. 19428wG2_WT2a]NYS26987.1 ABC transporter ATP-binding protein [Gemella sp. GL1]TFU59164.1 ABC transporter ATP-binding protein [Gemella sp. WT2a]